MIRIAMPVLLAFAALGPATAGTGQKTDADRLSRALAGLTPGKPTSCVPHFKFREVQPYAGTILYYQGRGRLWRNDVQGRCNGLRRGDIIVTTSHNSEYCRGDLVQTRERSGGFVTGSCVLGDFTPYSK